MKRPWIKWYPSDYINDTRLLTLSEHGIYRLMLDHAWLNNGYLPASPRKFEKITGIKWGKKVGKICTLFWQKTCMKINEKEEPIYTQKRLKKELQNYIEVCAKNADSGLKGAEIRWGKDSDRHSDRHSEGIATATSSGMANATQINAQSQKPETRSQNIKEKTNKKEKVSAHSEAPSAPQGGTGRVSEIEVMCQTKFDEARQAFGGIKRGLNTEWTNFKKKNKDWRATVHKLMPAVQREAEWRTAGTAMNAFVPQWPQFQTWINQKRWEQELPAHTPEKGGNDERLQKLLKIEG